MEKKTNTNASAKATTARLMTDTGARQTGSDLEFKVRLQKIVEKIHSAKNLDEILINLIDDIAALFNSERITIFVLEAKTKQLVSRFKIGAEIAEYRIPILPKSITGYVAHKQKLVNIANAYDETELGAIDPALKHDKIWDKKTGFTTKQVLALPIFFRKYLMGVLMLMNRKSNDAYSKPDEVAAKELAGIIGIGLNNQRRTANKFHHLLEKHLITPKELKSAMTEAMKESEPIESYLVSRLKIPKKDLGICLEKFYEVPFIEYDESTPIPVELLKYLKLPFMKKNIWVPLHSEGDKIIVALDNPQDFRKIGEIKSVFPKNQIEFRVALKEDILDYISLFTEDRKEASETNRTVKKQTDGRETDSDFEDMPEELMDGISDDEDDDEDEDEVEEVDEQGSAIVKLVNKIIIDSFNKGATDIHFEPHTGKQKTVVRVRIEGRCSVYQKIPHTYRRAIVSRIKIMSDLNIVEHLRPQEGKIKFKKYEGMDIELRVTVIPIRGGLESVTLHFLETSKPVPVDQMELSKYNYDNYTEAISKPYGAIIVSGPIGSGRAITLHSTIGHLNSDDNKIWTAEDPVEIVQKGLSQIEVKPETGLNFATAMRAILLADPDIVMIEEIKEKEIAYMVVDAALKGNLVFTSLYANSAAETITRMMEMGVDPYNFSNTLICVMTQKLAYTLCTKCKTPYIPSREEYDEIVREYGAEDFGKDVNIKYSKDLILHREKGCDICSHTGYKGQIAVHELIYVNEEMKLAIRRNATIEEVLELAVKDGMRTIKQDGIQKMFQGHTNMREVHRVAVV
ncbi:MAG: Flp pilus assembly complex ATPase component [Desulfobacteraceae bacterium]|nr:Flp pilus assembly complex ATPase component [Desulfobacteraceae bacterium]